jgi:hypothetical protein
MKAPVAFLARDSIAGGRRDDQELLRGPRTEGFK